MKTTFNILLAGLCAAALISCSKESGPKVNNGDFQVTFEAGTLDFGDDGTKVTHSISGTKHSFAWEAGDQISMVLFNGAGGAGVAAEGHVANTSARRFTLTEGTTGQFTGTLNEEELAALGGGTSNLNAFVVYPATNVTVSETSTNSSTFYYYILDGFEFPTTQDGTGIRYCYFTSTDVQFNRSAKVFSSAAKTLYLSHVLIRFNIANSAKDIKNIKIDTESAYFVGPAKYWIGHTSSAPTEFMITNVGRRAIQAGCAVKTCNINNGGVLPNEIYVACRGMQAKAVTLTFTATDDTECTISTTLPSANYSPGIYNWGTINLASATWN